DGGGRPRLGLSSVEPGVASDSQRLLADLSDTAADHVFDLVSVHTGALDEGLEGEAEHLDGVPAAEIAAAFAERRPPAADDHRLARAVAAPAGAAFATCAAVCTAAHADCPPSAGLSCPPVA